MNLRHWTILGTLFFALNIGCASLSTTPITRLDSGTLVGDSNGKSRLFQKSRPFRGVPVKLKVQTHVDVWIHEEYLLARAGKHEKWGEKNLNHRLFEVETKPVMSDKVVITDFKRPASGVIDLTVDFNGDQYFKKIDSKVEDTTITDSAKLLSTIITKTGLASPVSKTVRTSASSDINHSWETRTVAYCRFDINAVDYEQQVKDFLDKHLNGCNPCGNYPNYSQPFLNVVTSSSDDPAPADPGIQHSQKTSSYTIPTPVQR